jgi:hypothetical protein
MVQHKVSVTGQKVLDRARELMAADPHGGFSHLAWATNALTLVELLRGPTHGTAASLASQIEHGMRHSGLTSKSLAVAVRGVLLGLINDLEAGFLPDLVTRVRGEVEGDLLGQVQRLLDDRMKDPAAMLVGAVLEDALRQLCRKHNLAGLERSTIEPMNEALRKADVYGLPQKQQVTAWAAIRNKADHARFPEYTLDEVRLMHQGVAGFIAMYLGSAPLTPCMCANG